jgi:3-oxoacyl-[acyl-carrier-protein] synthase II
MNKGDTSVAPTRTPRHDVFITGVGVVLPGAVGNDAFRDRLLSAAPARLTEDAGPIGDDAIAHLLSARRVRRMSEYVKLSLAATTLALRDAGVDDVPAFAASCSAVLGSTHGSANYSAEYYGQIVREGIKAANPLLFAEGVPNAAAAHLSLMLALKGACQTIIGTRTAGLDALRLAAARVAAGEWDRAVVGAGEEYSRVVNDAYRHCGLYAGAAGARGFFTGCGAVTLVLESRRSIAARGGPAPRGAVEAWSSAASFRELRGEIESARRVLRDIGSPRHVIGSANGTWIDRAETAAVRHSIERREAPRTYATLNGHMAETFSVNPLAAVAAVLLTGRVPALLGPVPPGLSAPDDADRPRSVGVLCTDYAGLVAGCRIGLGERAAA